MSHYEIRARRYGGKYGSGLTEFVRKGLICKRLRKYVSLNIELICSELTVSNKHGVLSIYRPPDHSNMMRALNIDIRQTSLESINELEEFCSFFRLTNTIKS